MEIPEVEKSYMAGLLDGEGAFSLYLDSTGHVAVRISFSNRSLEVCEWARERWGGYLYTKAKDKCNRMRWSDRISMQALLTSVLPYMISKKNEAEILLAYTEGMGNGPGKRSTSSMVEKLELMNKLSNEHGKRNSNERYLHDDEMERKEV